MKESNSNERNSAAALAFLSSFGCAPEIQAQDQTPIFSLAYTLDVLANVKTGLDQGVAVKFQTSPELYIQPNIQHVLKPGWDFRGCIIIGARIGLDLL